MKVGHFIWNKVVQRKLDFIFSLFELRVQGLLHKLNPYETSRTNVVSPTVNGIIVLLSQYARVKVDANVGTLLHCCTYICVVQLAVENCTDNLSKRYRSELLHHSFQLDWLHWIKWKNAPYAIVAASLRDT